MPDLVFNKESKTSSLLFPIDETIPNPVTTTLHKLLLNKPTFKFLVLYICLSSIKSTPSPKPTDVSPFSNNFFHIDFILS